MLLAAGLGKRMRPLTDTLPKPLFEAGGMSLIEHQLVKLHAAGFRDVVVNLHHLGHLIEERLGDGSRYGIDITYSREIELLETGGGIKAALKYLGEEPFAVVSADVLIEMDFAVLDRALPAGSLGYLIMAPNPAHHPEGDFSLEGEALGHGSSKLTYTGLGVLSPGLVRNVEATAFTLRQQWDAAIDEGRMHGGRFDGYWCDVGTVDRYEALKKHLSSKDVGA